MSFAERSGVLTGDSLRFEVPARASGGFQFGGLVASVWYEDRVESSAASTRVRDRCYLGQGQLSARVTVHWEVFDDLLRRVVFRRETRGAHVTTGHRRDFAEAFHGAVRAAYDRLVADPEVLAWWSGAGRREAGEP